MPQEAQHKALAENKSTIRLYLKTSRRPSRGHSVETKLPSMTSYQATFRPPERVQNVPGRCEEGSPSDVAKKSHRLLEHVDYLGVCE